MRLALIVCLVTALTPFTALSAPVKADEPSTFRAGAATEFCVSGPPGKFRKISGFHRDAAVGLSPSGPLSLTGCTKRPIRQVEIPSRVVIGDVTENDTAVRFWTSIKGKPDQYAAVRHDLAASGTGGTPGAVSTNVNIYTNVAARRSDSVWGLLSRIDNSATTAAENVAGYFQSRVTVAGASPTWAGVLEMRDTSNDLNPTKARVALELDNFGNGSDTNNNKVGLDIVIGRSSVNATQNELGFGVRVGPQDGVSRNGRIKKAFSIENTDFDVGFDTSAATSKNGVSFRMASNQKFSLVSTNDRYITYTSSGFQYYVGTKPMITVSDDGSVTAPRVNATIINSPSSPPQSSTSDCATGDTAWDANYEYRCVARNRWKRAALSAW